MEAPVRRIARLVVFAIVGLVGLVAATAAGNVAAYRDALLINGSPQTAPYPADEIVLVLATAALAGAIYTVFLLDRRLPRTLVAGLGILSIGSAVAVEYLRRQDGFVARLVPAGVQAGRDSVPGRDLLLQDWVRYAVPTVVAALVAVTMVVAAVGRRPIVLYLNPYSPPPPRPSALAGTFAILAGAAVWAAAGLGAVALAAAAGMPSTDWLGQVVPASGYDFAGDGELYLVAGVSTVVGGLLYFLVLSRRLHWGVPIGVAAAYLTVTVWSFVDTLTAVSAKHPELSVYPASKLLTALELAAQVPAAAAGTLLAVPLLIAGVRRRREDTKPPLAMAEDTMTIPDLYSQAYQ
jgi:hypothetical protein